MSAIFFRRFATVLGIGIAIPCFLTAAHADTYTFAPFNLFAPGLARFAPQYADYELTGAPAGTVYKSYTATLDWTSIDNAYSSEAIFGLSSGVSGNGLTYSNPSIAKNGQDNDISVQLKWSGNLVNAYTGGDPLHFFFGQYFIRSDATWDNINLTVNTALIPVPPPPSTFVPLTQSLTSYTGLIEFGNVEWYSFVYRGGPLEIDTVGSDPGVDEIAALYDASGVFQGAGNGFNQNTFDFNIGDTYYLAVLGDDVNDSFDNGFRVTGNSFNTGNYQLNFTVVIPEAGTANLLLLGTLPVLVGAARAKQRYKKA